jgi:hypothetical protein
VGRREERRGESRKGGKSEKSRAGKKGEEEEWREGERNS